jgi:hypothetical protein
MVPQTGADTYRAPVSLTDASGDEVAFDIQYTVNKAAGNDTGLRINQIDSSSPGTSFIIELLRNNVAQLSLDNSGNLTITGTLNGRDPAADGVLAASAVQPGDNISDLTNDSGFAPDQTDSEIEIAYNNQVAIVSQIDAETGTSTDVKRWTPQRVAS